MSWGEHPLHDFLGNNNYNYINIWNHNCFTAPSGLLATGQLPLTETSSKNWKQNEMNMNLSGSKLCQPIKYKFTPSSPPMLSLRCCTTLATLARVLESYGMFWIKFFGLLDNHFWPMNSQHLVILNVFTTSQLFFENPTWFSRSQQL